MSSPDISTGLDVIIDYKCGRIDLNAAVYQFCSATGLSEEIARKFMTGLSRDNVVPLQKRQT